MHRETSEAAQRCTEKLQVNIYGEFSGRKQQEQEGKVTLRQIWHGCGYLGHVCITSHGIDNRAEETADSHDNDSYQSCTCKMISVVIILRGTEARFVSARIFMYAQCAYARSNLKECTCSRVTNSKSCLLVFAKERAHCCRLQHCVYGHTFFTSKLLTVNS